MMVEPQSSNKKDNAKQQAAAGAGGASETNDRLMQMMDKKFSKFEDIITQIATNMGQLQGEVNQMKGKLADAKLLWTQCMPTHITSPSIFSLTFSSEQLL